MTALEFSSYLPVIKELGAYGIAFFLLFKFDKSLNLLTLAIEGCPKRPKDS